MATPRSTPQVLVRRTGGTRVAALSVSSKSAAIEAPGSARHRRCSYSAVAASASDPVQPRQVGDGAEIVVGDVVHPSRQPGLVPQQPFQQQPVADGRGRRRRASVPRRAAMGRCAPGAAARPSAAQAARAVLPAARPAAAGRGSRAARRPAQTCTPGTTPYSRRTPSVLRARCPGRAWRGSASACARARGRTVSKRGARNAQSTSTRQTSSIGRSSWTSRCRDRGRRRPRSSGQDDSATGCRSASRSMPRRSDQKAEPVVSAQRVQAPPAALPASAPGPG